MVKSVKNMSAIILGIFVFLSCMKDTPDNDSTTGPVWNEKDLVPIIMVHGMLASGDTYAKPAMHLLSNGYPENLLYTLDWNTTSGNNARAIQDLDTLVNTVIAETGKDQVVIIGHSAGGGVGYNYCSQPGVSSKIARYIHIGSNPQAGPAGPEGEIPTLNIYSKGDLIVQGSDIPDAINVVFDSLDHYQVATSVKSFEAIFRFLFPQVQAYTTDIRPVSTPEISGRVVSLGENSPAPDVKVTMYYVDPLTAQRKGSGVTVELDNNGNFQNIPVDPSSHIEFVLESDREGFRTLHYYREPFVSDNPFVYLRVFPPAASLAGVLLSGLPKSDAQSVVAVFSANNAIIHQRDILEVQGIQLANENLCRPSNSTIALFMYDNGSRMSSGSSHPLFNFVPFLKGAQMFFDTSEPGSIPIRYNNRTMAVRNYKSDSEGVVIAVFD
jgi:pimeloyl-ACP methyl ester carboxylesterase